MYAYISKTYVLLFSLQELKSKPVRDEAAVQELLNEILKIDQSQREQLNLVRETENSYTSLSDIQEDVLYCTENLSSDGSPVKSEDEKEAPEGSVVDFRITGNEIKPKPVVASPLPDVPEAPPQEPETVQEEMQDDGVMNWEDLTREQWTETDKLLQKVERVGSRVLQPDFLSTMGKVKYSVFHKEMLYDVFVCRFGSRCTIPTCSRMHDSKEIAYFPRQASNHRTLANL